MHSPCGFSPPPCGCGGARWKKPASLPGWSRKINALAVALDATALAPRLEQADAAGHRDIEAVHRAVHGDAHQFVAGLARQPAQSRAFRPEHQRHALRQIAAINILLRLGGGAE